MDAAMMEQRIIELESLVTHMQHDLETFNQVILEQQAALADLAKTVSRLDKQLGDLPEEGAAFDPDAERPPHY